MAPQRAKEETSGLTETISYRDEGNGCSRKRAVVERSPGLKGAKGVSFDESFALFTTGPDGRVQLRTYRSHDYPATNEAVATDCALHWKPAALRTPGPNPFAGVERGTSTGAAPAPRKPTDQFRLIDKYCLFI